MPDINNVLEIRDLHVHFHAENGVIHAVNGASLVVPEGKIVGLVGESGCGKSATGLSVMRLTRGRIASGEIRFNGRDLTTAPEDAMRRIRGRQIAMIFQEPATSLDPVYRIGTQIAEAIAHHRPELTRREVKARVIETLETAGLSAKAFNMYPHQLSGGMLKRAMIAMAISLSPALLIADEPTTALDVTLQAQILELIKSMRDKLNAAILLITHDFGVLAQTADYVFVMYAGRIVERGAVRDILYHPAHPYTIGLLNSMPYADTDRLHTIPGELPDPMHLTSGCCFRERCTHECAGELAIEIALSETHGVCCARGGL